MKINNISAVLQGIIGSADDGKCICSCEIFRINVKKLIRVIGAITGTLTKLRMIKAESEDRKMRTYTIKVGEEEKDVIHAEKMTAEQLYKKLSAGFGELYIPRQKVEIMPLHKRE